MNWESEEEEEEAEEEAGVVEDDEGAVVEAGAEVAAGVGIGVGVGEGVGEVEKREAVEGEVEGGAWNAREEGGRRERESILFAGGVVPVMSKVE